MKRFIVRTSLLFLALPLTSCVWFTNKNWKKEYGTPELFLSQVSTNHSRIFMYGEESSDLDYYYEVRDALYQVAPFQKTDKTKSTSDKYFTYYDLVSHATTGPNYCTMAVYADGFIKIDYKSSLGPHQYAYFEFDESRAPVLVDFVFEKIATERGVKEEDERKALEDGKIENFFQMVEQKETVKTMYADMVKNGIYIETYDNHYFYDDGLLLDMLKDVTYTQIENYSDYDHYHAVIYNCQEDYEESRWELVICSGGEHARITYQYTNRFDEHLVVDIDYLIDEAKGKSIITSAEELAKQ